MTTNVHAALHQPHPIFSQVEPLLLHLGQSLQPRQPLQSLPLHMLSFSSVPQLSLNALILVTSHVEERVMRNDANVLWLNLQLAFDDALVLRNGQGRLGDDVVVNDDDDLFAVAACASLGQR